MDSRAPKQAPSKTEGKKLKLNKETLKDLSAADKDIKGGRLPTDSRLCTGEPCD